jgi:hypothetical protein
MRARAATCGARATGTPRSAKSEGASARGAQIPCAGTAHAANYERFEETRTAAGGKSDPGRRMHAACTLRYRSRMKTIERRSLRDVSVPLVGAALVVSLASACGPERQTVVRRESVAIEQRAVPPPRAIDISIIDLHDEPSPDPSQEKIVGTIVNDGNKAVSGLSIRLNALDSSGQVVRTITTPPLRETIAAGGGRTRFEAFMPADPQVAGYHAVAIAR